MIVLWLFVLIFFATLQFIVLFFQSFSYIGFIPAFLGINILSNNAIWALDEYLYIFMYIIMVLGFKESYSKINKGGVAGLLAIFLLLTPVYTCSYYCEVKDPPIENENNLIITARPGFKPYFSGIFEIFYSPLLRIDENSIIICPETNTLSKRLKQSRVYRVFFYQMVIETPVLILLAFLLYRIKEAKNLN